MNEPTSFELDERQRAMLAEMGVRVWLPSPVSQSVPMVRDTTAPVPIGKPAHTNVSVKVPAAIANATAAHANANAVATAHGLLPNGIAQMGGPALQAAVSACQACALCQGRKQALLGEGAAPAAWMVVGDAPGEDEDQSGGSFAGPAGALLDNMLKAVGLQRSQVFLTHAVKCRTPSGRSPSLQELSQCAPYLSRQVALVQPQVILAMGRTAVQALLQSAEPLGKLRGQSHAFQGVPVVVTYPPSYLLRSQGDKAKAWADLCAAAALVEG